MKPVERRAGGLWLPSMPLSDAIDRAITREARTRGEICNDAGVTPRMVFHWRSGVAHEVELKLADLVTTRLELLWWDVWNENTVRRPLLKVGIYIPHSKKSRTGGRFIFWDRGQRCYGDAGPDADALHRIALIWEGEVRAAA